MKEFIVDLFPNDGGFQTKTRIFAPNAATALLLAKNMNPKYRTGGFKEIENS